MKRPILIIAAMDIEVVFLVKKMQNVNEFDINKYKFFEGTISDYPIVICICNCMTINAATATCIAIQKYNPIAIINEGTSGAHSRNIHRGDIVIGEKCVNIVSYKSPHKSENGGSNSLEWKLLNFIHGEKNRLEYQHGDENLIKLAKNVELDEGDVHFGIIGSGDCWNNETDRILWLNKTCGTLCEEMEGIAVYTLANNFNIPVLGIRVISNNEILGEKYDEKTALKSQKFTYKLILKFINKY